MALKGIYRFNSAIYIIVTYLVSFCRSLGTFQFSFAYFTTERGFLCYPLWWKLAHGRPELIPSHMPNVELLRVVFPANDLPFSQMGTTSFLPTCFLRQDRAGYRTSSK